MQYFLNISIETVAVYLLNMMLGIVVYMDYFITSSRQSFKLYTIIISVLQSRKHSWAR